MREVFKELSMFNLEETGNNSYMQAFEGLLLEEEIKLILLAPEPKPRSMHKSYKEASLILLSGKPS